jgi:hypothetical protein
MSEAVKSLPAVLNIRTEGLDAEATRLPFDLICVLDKSGSMAGEKIKLVKDTLKFLLEELD